MRAAYVSSLTLGISFSGVWRWRAFSLTGELGPSLSFDAVQPMPSPDQTHRLACDRAAPGHPKPTAHTPTHAQTIHDLPQYGAQGFGARSEPEPEI